MEAAVVGLVDVGNENIVTDRLAMPCHTLNRS